MNVAYVQKRQPLSDGTQKVVAVRQVTNDLGEVVEEQVVDSRFLQLDPVQAENIYRQQKRKERLRTAGQIGLGTLSIIPAFRFARMAGAGITSLGKKLFTQPVTRKGGLGEILETGRRFTTAPFVQQFPKTSAVFKFGTPPAVPAAILTAGSVGDPLEEQITALEENRSDESIAGDGEVIETGTTGKIIKVSASDDDNRVKTGDDNLVKTGDDNLDKTADDANGANGAQDDNTIEKTNLFGSERFLDFIRNVGTSLATSENLGKGLVQGAAAAAQERAVKDALKQEQFADILKAQIENLGISPSDAKTATEINKNISNTIRDYDNTNRNIARVDEAIYYLKNDPRTAGGIGFLGFLGKVKDQLFSFANVNSATSFDQLEPRTKVDAILNVLQQEGIREILGEAGRAISNLDRQIVQEVFGNITITTSLAEILKKLEDSRDRFIKAQDQRRTDMIADTGFFQSTRIPSSVIQTNENKIKEIITYTPPKTSTFIREADGEDAIDIPLNSKEKLTDEFAASR